MAQKVQVLLVDDVDGGEADETVSFGLDNTAYEIDLSEKNAMRLREELASFVPHARRVGGRARPTANMRRRPAPAAPPPAPAPAPTAAPAKNSADEQEVSPKVIREWAAKNGVRVSDRGRIPADVVQKYRAAQG